MPRVVFFLIVFICLSTSTAQAAWWTPPTTCQEAVDNAERNARIPTHLLDAISKVESGRRGAEGALVAWPWTINAQGQGYFYNSKAEAIAAARDFQQRGIDSIDVGCMQINLHHHPNAFMSLDQAFDPVLNAQYGAHFLNELFERFQGWTAAIAGYHSLSPGLGQDYMQRVMAMWGQGGTQGTYAQNSLTGGVPFPVNGNMPRPRPFAAASFAPVPHVIHPTINGSIPGASSGLGRTLTAYRLNPVRLAWRR